MLSFKDVLEEKIKIHVNKGITIYFSDYKDHTFIDRLDRANLSKSQFMQKLNSIISKIKEKKLESGEYGFVFDKFKVPVNYDKENKIVLIKTILTDNMKLKDKIFFLVESIEYKIIYMENCDESL